MYNEKLGSAIKTKYKTFSEFADIVGWPKQRVNKLLYGKIAVKVSDVNCISKALDIPVRDAILFF